MLSFYIIFNVANEYCIKNSKKKGEMSSTHFFFYKKLDIFEIGYKIDP